MKLNPRHVNLDDLGREAVRLGRELAEQACALNLGQTSLDAAFVNRCLARFKERQPFSDADEGCLSTIATMLKKDIKSEIVEIEVHFVETHFDDAGQHGEQRSFPIYSERGKALLDLQQLLEDFLSIRNAILDHLAAHRTLMNMMSG